MSRRENLDAKRSRTRSRRLRRGLAAFAGSVMVLTALAVALPGSADPSHGFAVGKNCHGPVKPGDQLVCQFTIENTEVLSAHDTWTIDFANPATPNPISDVVFSPSSGQQPTVNFPLSSFTLAFTGGAACTATLCTLPFGSTIQTNFVPVYTVAAGDVNGDHTLTDIVTIVGINACPVVGQNGCSHTPTPETGTASTNVLIQPSVSTQLSPAGPVAIGTPVTDQATLTGASTNPLPGGTMTYAVYSNNTCTTLVQSLGVKTINAGVIPPSNIFTPSVGGRFWFQATYSGDANNLGFPANPAARSACTSERLVVKFNPSVSTQLSPPGPVEIGTPITDQATLTGASTNPLPGGTMTYAVYSNNTCTTLVQALGVKTINAGVIPASNPFTPLVSGNFWFQATYSGDANNLGFPANPAARSACTSEPIHVLHPDISIVKKTNGADANDPNGTDVPEIMPGQPVTWTYIVTNTGETHVPRANVSVTDNQTGVTPVFSSESIGNGDTIFDPGEVWLYTATGAALDLTAPPVGVLVQTGVCTHGGTEPPRTAYVNLGTATIPSATDNDPSSYCNPPPHVNANFTPGYWKNHADATQALLPLNLGNHTVFTAAEATIIMNGMGCGHDGPVNCMAGMLLAAELNFANGGSTCIKQVLIDANQFLADHGYAGYDYPPLTPISPTDAAIAKNFHDVLSAYNIDGVPTC
jgi:uncharacterized repeat protein (TIGR01451 family)